MKPMMLAKSVIFMALLTCSAVPKAQIVGRSNWLGGVDIRLEEGSNRSIGGAIIHGGYDFLLHPLDILSIEPRMGIGYFHGSHSKMFDTNITSSYNIGCLTASVVPKLYISISEDESRYIYFATEFMMMNSVASIDDAGSSVTRHASDSFRFSYTCKVGIQFNINEHSKMSFWVGGSSMKFTHLLNSGLSPNQKHYKGETIDLGAGLDFYPRF
jgi:hypothetical protein